MTAVEDTPTTVGTPFPGSRKTYLQGSRPDLRVPMRESLAPRLRGRQDRPLTVRT